MLLLLFAAVSGVLAGGKTVDRPRGVGGVLTASQRQCCADLWTTDAWDEAGVHSLPSSWWVDTLIGFLSFNKSHFNRRLLEWFVIE